jgi:hypothetical protein
MSDQDKRGNIIHAEVHGNVGDKAQVAIGEHIVQTQTIGATKPQVTEADLTELRRMLAELQAKIEAESPPDKKRDAAQRAGELEQAITAKEPDLSTLEYVQRWFAKNLPSLAGAVTSVIVHPIVGKVVEAAGDVIANEFRRRFGRTS